MSRFAACLALFFFSADAIFAADQTDALERIPIQADLVFKVEHPRSLIEGVIAIDAYQGLQQFPQAREILESTPVRRFFQTIRYLETELGEPWPVLLDRVAGNGLAVGVAFGKEPQPALFIIEGKDAEFVAKAHALLLKGIRDELERNQPQTQLVTEEFENVTVTSIGKDFFTTQIGTTIFVSNNKNAIGEAVKLALGKIKTKVTDHATVIQARKLAGPKAVAWGWLNFAKVKESKESKDFFASTKKDIFQTMIFGSTVDAARRSDFITFVLEKTETGYSAGVRLPAKRAELDPDLAIHAPFHGESGSKPLLRPKGVIYSQSFYLDLGFLWKERKRIFNQDNLKDIEKGIEQLNRVLPNTTFGQILENSGPYHRLVAAHTGEKLYTSEPAQSIPPVAYIGSMRSSTYGETMEALLRAGGLIAGFQTKWKMTEQEFMGTNIVTYRFPETGTPNYDDPEKYRFNAAPSFAIVNDSIILGSTPGIVQLLIPEIKKESATDGSHKVWQGRFIMKGASQFLKANPEATITQTILSQGIGLAEAQKQTNQLANWLGQLGSYEISIDHAKDYFEFRIAWNYGN